MREPTLGEALAATYDFMTGRRQEASDRGYHLTPTSEIAPERVSWLWTGRVPAGTVTVLDGDPGKCKSTLTAALAAAVSTGTPLPGDDRMDPGGVIFVSLEDDPAMVIVPRLIAAGADLTRIHIPVMVDAGGERLPQLPDDLARIQQMVWETDARLVVIDPLMAALSADVNGNQDQDVRRVLAELARIAGATGAAVVLVRHLNKSAGKVAIYRGGGSIGIIGAARSGLLLTAHPHDPAQLLLTVSKSNLGVRPKALAVRIVQAANGFGTVAWGEEAEISADDALTGISEETPTEPDGELGAAIAWLRAALADGPMPSKQVYAEAKENGIALRTLKRAKAEAGIGSRRINEPEPYWQWFLVESEATNEQECQAEPNVENVGTLGTLTREALPGEVIAIYKESSSEGGASDCPVGREQGEVCPAQGCQECQGGQPLCEGRAVGTLAGVAPTDVGPGYHARPDSPDDAPPHATVGQGDNPAAVAEAMEAGTDQSLDPQHATLDPTGRRCPDCFTPLPDGAERCPPCAEAYAYLLEQQAARAAGIIRTW
jgi:hypothetical protein